MRKLVVVLGFVNVLCCSAFGQNAPRAEVFGGYSYLNFDASSPTFGLVSRQNLNGWEASAAFNLNRWVGLEGDFSGHYRGECFGVPGLSCKHLSFMGGPRFTYRTDRITLFAHGLFGADNGSGSVGHFSLSDTPFALAVGGGFDYPVTEHISVRVAQVDYFVTRHANDLGLPHQNNIRVSAGIVFTFGGMRESAPRQTAPSVSPRRQPATSQCEDISEAALLGVIGCESANGFLVTSVRAASPAAQAGVNPGDVVVSMDGREVHSSHDIETVVAASASGTVRISFMVRNAWLTQQDVRVR